MSLRLNRLVHEHCYKYLPFILENISNICLLYSNILSSPIYFESAIRPFWIKMSIDPALLQALMAQLQASKPTEKIKFGKQEVDLTRGTGHLSMELCNIPIVVYTNCHELLEEAATRLEDHFRNHEILNNFKTYPIYAQYTGATDSIENSSDSWRNRIVDWVALYHSEDMNKKMFNNDNRPKVMAEIRFKKNYLVAVATLNSNYYWTDKMFKTLKYRYNVNYVDKAVSYDLLKPDKGLEYKDSDYITIALEHSLRPLKSRLREITNEKEHSEESNTIPAVKGKGTILNLIAGDDD